MDPYWSILITGLSFEGGFLFIHAIIKLSIRFIEKRVELKKERDVHAR